MDLIGLYVAAALFPVLTLLTRSELEAEEEKPEIWNWPPKWKAETRVELPHRERIGL